ncbi:MAG: site-2 protease family protein [Lacunisphaera sp.]|nr:site-2 protease family protein [Lacunisphaera sp.]
MLGWSINLFKVFGIQLAVHASFVLLLAYYGYEGWVEGGLPGLLWSVGLISLFFVCVILHELGHSLTARRYGVRTARILLLPIGGMAELEQIPRKPSAELLITVAGPAVNFVLVALLLPFAWHGIFSEEEVALYSPAGLAIQLCIANLIMGVFNLVPVFPMDGGRIFRALLAIRLPYVRATYWAVMVGRVLAVLLAVWALYKDNYMLAVLFMFIFFAGTAEYRQTLRREQEDAYWAEMARRARLVAPAGEEPPLLIHGPN